MKAICIAVAMALLFLAGCGSGGGGERTRAATDTGTGTTAAAGSGMVIGKLPPGAVGPVDKTEQTAEGPAATEASPEAQAIGPKSTGDVPDADRSAVEATVSDYVSALDRRDAARVCALIAAGGIPLSDLPRRRGGCPTSLRASIGTRPAGGGPAWRRTQIAVMKPEALGDNRARVTTTVTHHFSDRRYVSVEDDVIYLERIGERWLIAKPSATFYRAVGYAQPPLRAFSPPTGW